MGDDAQMADQGTVAQARSSTDSGWVAATLTVVVSAAYCLPYVVFGRAVRVNPWDSLDSSWVMFELAAEHNTLAKWGGTIPGLLGGLPAVSLGSDLFLPRLLLEVMDLFPAYVLSAFLARSIAFYGMARLLQLSLFGQRMSTPVIVALSVIWAWQPYWSPVGIAVLGLPLLASAYIRMRHGTATWHDWAIAALVPFFGSAVYGGVFAAALAGLDVVVRAARRLPVRQPMVGILLFLSVSVLVEIEGLLAFPGESHRSSWALSRFHDELSISDFVGPLSPSDVVNIHTPIVGLSLMLIVALAGATVATHEERQPLRHPRAVAPALLALAAVALIVLAKFALNPPITDLRALLGKELQTFRLRFDWLAPLPAFVGAAMGFDVLARRGTIHRVLSTGGLMILVAGTVACAEWAQMEHPTWDGFLLEEELQPVVDVINRCSLEEGSVMVVGIHPSVVQHHGLPTVGGYFQRYPQRTKEQFRDVIAMELADAPVWRRYFDDWGSRAYVFTSELGQPGFGPLQPSDPIHLDVDLQLARERFHARWVVSAAEISNAEELGIAEIPVPGSDDVMLYGLSPRGDCSRGEHPG